MTDDDAPPADAPAPRDPGADSAEWYFGLLPLLAAREATPPGPLPRAAAADCVLDCPSDDARPLTSEPRGTAA